jgi:hypothetical protein
MFKQLECIVSKNPSLLFLSVLIACFFFIPEVFAFSDPIIAKANSAATHLVLIGKVLACIGLLYFTFTLFMARPNFMLLICTIVGASILVGWNAVKMWLQS